jgi:hypothetical protein
LTISRRQFFQMTGVAILSTVIPLPNFPAKAAPYGRTLIAAPVRHKPHETAAVKQQHWPDSILALAATNGYWHRTEQGYIARSHVQPMMIDPAAQPTSRIQTFPAWAEVSAAVAAVRQWCAPDAPLVTRIGHGGVAHVVDYLPGEIDWYGIAANSGDLLGWSPAVRWQPITEAIATRLPLKMVISQTSQRMNVSVEGKSLWEANISTGQSLQAGIYHIERDCAGGLCCAASQVAYHGAAWPLYFSDQAAITGVYWHNQFGESVPGPAVQITPYLARWLYAHCGMGSSVIIHL